MSQELQLAVVSGTVQLVGYEEWKKYLDETLKGTKNEVIDPNAIKEAQATLAKLRKVKTAINAERLAKEREYMTPFLTAKGQIAELIANIDEAIENLDTQVKAIQEAEDEKKKAEIEATWQLKHCGFTTFAKIFNPKWLNKSYEIKDVSKEMDEIIAKVDSDIEAILQQSGEDEAKRDELMSIYADEMDLGKTITTYTARVNAKKAQQEALEARQAQANASKPPYTPPTKPEATKTDKYSITIKFSASNASLNALLAYIKSNNIGFTVTEAPKKEE